MTNFDIAMEAVKNMNIDIPEPRGHQLPSKRVSVYQDSLRDAEAIWFKETMIVVGAVTAFMFVAIIVASIGLAS